MSLENLDRLEQKIEQLVAELSDLRKRNGESQQKDAQTNEKINILEKENVSLKNQLSESNRQAEEDRKKVETASERIRGLLGKLESV